MTTPRRIQRMRTKDWRMPPWAIYVGRPSRWRNPFRIERTGVIEMKAGDGAFKPLVTWTKPTLPEDRAQLVALFREWLALPGQDALRQAIRAELAGHDLACWCPIDQPCHADILLEIANA